MQRLKNIGVPATQSDKLPANVKEAFQQSHPLHQAFAEVWDELGGVNFLRDWAEDNPTAFIDIMLRLTPTPNAPLGGKDNVMHMHLHPSLQPGPLDVVGEHKKSND